MMDRRNFFKVLAAITGSAAITPALADSFPEQIPKNSEISIGYFVDGRFNRWQTINVDTFSGPNVSAIEFPMCTAGRAYITHAEVLGKVVQLDRSVLVFEMCIPRFPVGSLTITEE